MALGSEVIHFIGLHLVQHLDNRHSRIAQGKQDKLYLGNLSSLRDWGYAKDYVECMWLILQQERPEDFVIATGEQHSVREFCLYAFRRAGTFHDGRPHRFWNLSASFHNSFLKIFGQVGTHMLSGTFNGNFSSWAKTKTRKASTKLPEKL